MVEFKDFVDVSWMFREHKSKQNITSGHGHGYEATSSL